MVELDKVQNQRRQTGSEYLPPSYEEVQALGVEEILIEGRNQGEYEGAYLDNRTVL